MEPTAKRYLIVTADDFGLSPRVNEGILCAFRKGIVRNTTLMVNFADAAESAACLQGAPELDCGIHLNLTAGPPVSSPRQVSSLVDRSGQFHRLPVFLMRAAAGRIRWAEAEREWQAQVERGLRLGCRFTSISSHQHVHMLPALTKICAALAKRYQIPAVRLSRYLVRGLGSSMLKPVVLYSASLRARRILQRGGIACNDYSVGLFSARPSQVKSELCRLLSRLPAGVGEFVGHPGYVDDVLRGRDGFLGGRLVELEALTAADVHSAIGAAGIELYTYRQMSGVPA